MRRAVRLERESPWWLSRADLLARWTALLGPAAEPAGRDLLARWAEPHRGYHDLRHLAEVLDALDELTAGGPPPAVVLAAWWHDAVYEGRAGEDERASAALAARVLPALVRRGDSSTRSSGWCCSPRRTDPER